MNFKRILLQILVFVFLVGLLYACEKPEDKDTAGVFPAEFTGVGNTDTTATAK